jgi:hypothetical protein
MEEMKMDNEQTKFLAFEKVRMTGLTNMMATKMVINIADEYFGVILSKDDVIDCIKNYDLYANKYLDANTVGLLRNEVADAEINFEDSNNNSNEDDDTSY